MDKKKLVFSLGSFIFAILLINIVSAYYTPYYGGSFGVNIRQGSEDLINFFVNWAEPFLQAVLGGDNVAIGPYGYTYSYLLFEKFLLFIILLSFIYISLSKVSIFEDNKRVLLIVDVAVSILAVRFLDFIWLNTIIMQYQVLGIALTGILPFIIYLFFLHGIAQSAVVRKIGWVFFIMVYFGLWVTTESDNYGSIYFWTMVVSLLFLILDGTIHRALSGQKWKEADKAGTMQALYRVNSLIREYNNPVAGIPDNLRKKELKRLNKRKIELQKQLT